MSTFRAYRVHDTAGKIEGRLEDIVLDDLDPGEVVIRAAYSNINYKDALAATGAGKIMRRFPMVAGIDVSGHVHSSQDARFREGDAVVVIGCGLGEDRDGGYAEYVRVPGDSVMPLPDDMTLHEAMAYGTAGFTAALAVQRMQDNGQRPDLGPILVNGATGGVGSFAIDMLSGLGFEVVAFTGKPEATDYLEEIGAARVLLRGDQDWGKRPLEKALWGGAVDNVGNGELTWLTRTVKPLGNIASVGLAGGFEFTTTVMPFILRGINLLGINSLVIPMELKRTTLSRLAGDLRSRHIERIVTRTVPLDSLEGVFEGYIAGLSKGRTVVEIEPRNWSEPLQVDSS